MSCQTNPEVIPQRLPIKNRTRGMRCGSCAMTLHRTQLVAKRPTSSGPCGPSRMTRISPSATLSPVMSWMLNMWVTKTWLALDWLERGLKLWMALRMESALAWRCSGASCVGELSAGLVCTLWAPKASLAVSWQRHHSELNTWPTTTCIVLNILPKDLACTRPASLKLRCVLQSPSLKPGGSNVPGANACRIKTECPPMRSAFHTAWSLAKIFELAKAG